MAEPRKCDVCGKVYTPRRSDSMYCSGACKQKAKRIRSKRKYAPVWSAPVEEPPQAPPRDVEAAVLAAHRAANDLGRLAKCGPYQLRAACARVSAAIQAALDEEGI